MNRLRCLVVLLGILAPTLAFAYKVRCNDEQTQCEVDTKRLAMGDRVGIFSDDGLIVAIGTVKKLKGRLRVVHVDKKYADIKKSYELVLIRDEEAQNPREFFKFSKATPERAFGATLGFTNMGVGEGFTAIDGQFYMQWKFRENTYYLGRGMFLTGGGKATHNTTQLDERDLTLTAIGAMGGLAYVLMPQHLLNFRFEGAAGFAQVNAAISGGVDAKEYVDGRIKPGMGHVIRLEAAAIYHWDDWKFIGAADYLRLQSSNNFGVAFGSLFTF